MTRVLCCSTLRCLRRYVAAKPRIISLGDEGATIQSAFAQFYGDRPAGYSRSNSTRDHESYAALIVTHSRAGA